MAHERIERNREQKRQQQPAGLAAPVGASHAFVAERGPNADAQTSTAVAEPPGVAAAEADAVERDAPRPPEAAVAPRPEVTYSDGPASLVARLTGDYPSRAAAMAAYAHFLTGHNDGSAEAEAKFRSEIAFLRKSPEDVQRDAAALGHFRQFNRSLAELPARRREEQDARAARQAFLDGEYAEVKRKLDERLATFTVAHQEAEAQVMALTELQGQRGMLQAQHRELFDALA